MVLEDAQNFQQEIAEVSGVDGFQPRLIIGIELATQAIGEAMGLALRNFIGREAAVFPAINDARQLPCGPTLFINAFGLNELLEQAHLVIIIQNREAGFEACKLSVVAQDFDTNGMESAEPRHALNHIANQMADAFLHFTRRFVGEGDGENLVGVGFAAG